MIHQDQTNHMFKELTVTKDTVQWLASLGYPVKKKSQHDLETMFLWEAAQLMICPLELKDVINNVYNEPAIRFSFPDKQKDRPPASGVKD